MNSINALILTLGVGLFIILGALIAFIANNNEKFIHFSISLAFGVMLSLIALELFPESFHLMTHHFDDFTSYILIIIFILIGFGLLKLLDLFIPDHEHGHNKKEHNENLFHIGLVSSIALIMHNIIEGMAIYTSCLSDLNMGLLMCIGVGLHNIPLGMVIASTFYKSNNSILKTLISSFLIAVSTFFGGFIIYILSGNIIDSLALGIMLSITLGMLLYIVFLELLPKIKEDKNKTISILGTILGVVILIVSLFLSGHTH